MLPRRQFLQLSVAASGGALLGCSTRDSGSVDGPAADDWHLADQIVQSIREVQIPGRDFVVEDFGAVADSGEDATLAIADAIAAAHAAGGGRVVCARGVYQTAAIHLKSNVELHVAEGATLSFSTDPSRYLPAVFTRWEGMEMMGYSPLIYAYGQQNIAVTGGGVLNGNADDQTWWPWKGAHKERHWDLIDGEDQRPARDALQTDVLAGVDPRERQYAEGSFLRPAFVQFYACTQVKIEGVTLVNSPFWLLHPVLCESVVVRGVTCRSHGPNNDGCDPESCKNVLIEQCVFDTGDDCIALKSGRNEDGRRVGVAVENVVVRHCEMRDGHGGLVLGSEISGGARNIFMEHCTMNSPHLERALRFKTNARRGGVIEKVRVRHVHIRRAQEALVVNFYYEEGEAGEHMPTVRDILVEDLRCDQVERVFHLRGFAHNPVGAITLRRAQFGQVAEADIIEHAPSLTLEQVVR